MKLNHFFGYTYGEDRLGFEFFKYSVFSSYLFTYYGRKTFVRMLYSDKNAMLSDYFFDLFEIIDLDCLPELSVQNKSHKLSYLEKSIKETEPLIYIDPAISPVRIFDLPNYDQIFFLEDKKSDVLNEYAKVYNIIGVYNYICNDNVFYVPKELCSNILKDVQRIQSEYNFTSEFMDKLLPFIIQTHAIIEDVQIQFLDKDNFLEYSDETAMFLSNYTSIVFKD